MMSSAGEEYLEELTLGERVTKLETLLNDFLTGDWIELNDKLLATNRLLARARLDLAQKYAFSFFAAVGPTDNSRLCVNHARSEAVRLREVIKASYDPDKIPDDYMK